jgi:pimeloyl-ACP methyl ester carboxylesterase
MNGGWNDRLCGKLAANLYYEVNTLPLVTINDTRLHTVKLGEGPPIVLIHPPLLSGRIFDSLCRLLSSSYTLIIFDIRGHGESLPSNRPVNFHLIAEDIAALLDYYEFDRAYICGYSTGSSVMLETILTHPGRFVGGIALSGMPEAADPYLRFRIWLAAQLSAHASRFLTAAISFGNADSLHAFRMLYQTSKDGSFENIRQYFESSLSFSCMPMLPQIRLPILLLYGEKDRSFHKYAHLCHEKLANSSLYILPGQKHQLPLKSTEMVIQYVTAWLEGTESMHKDQYQVLQPNF